MLACFGSSSLVFKSIIFLLVFDFNCSSEGNFNRCASSVADILFVSLIKSKILEYIGCTSNNLYLVGLSLLSFW